MININRPAKVFQVDKLLAENGHVAVRLPAYHPELNPIENIWAIVKNYVALHNITFKMDDVRKLPEDKFRTILYCEAFFEEFGSSLRRDPDDPNVYSTTEGLKYVEEVTYKTYVTKAAGFAKRMPSSAMSYYLSVLANARLVKLHLDNGYSANYEAERFVHDVEAEHYFYPKTFAR